MAILKNRLKCQVGTNAGKPGPCPGPGDNSGSTEDENGRERDDELGGEGSGGEDQLRGPGLGDADASDDGGGNGESRNGRIITARSKETKPGNSELVDEGLRKFLEPHQLDGAAKAIESMDKVGGMMLCDGAGVGKTREALAVAGTYAKKGKKVLIVTKFEVIQPNWKKGTFSGSFFDDSKTMGVDVDLTNGKFPPKEGSVSITTYENLSAMEQYIDDDTVLIYDESHAAKGRRSQRGQKAKDINNIADKVLFMSATPLDRPSDLHYLAKAGVFGMKKMGPPGNEYYMPKSPDETYKRLGLLKETTPTPNGPVDNWVIDPEVGTSEVYKRLDSLFKKMTEEGLMVKREISMKGVDVDTQTIPIPDEAHEMLKKIEDKVKLKVKNPRLQKAITLMHQRRQLEPYKVEATANQIKKELAEGRQVVVFMSRVNESEVLGKEDAEGEREVITQSEGTVTLLKDKLAEMGITDVANLYGKSKGRKGTPVEDFQSGKNRVIVATIEAGGTGINLDDTVGDKPRTMLIMTPPFSAIGNVQAAGRVWRLNTKSDPRIRYMMTDTKVDKWNGALISKKMQTLGAVVSGQLDTLDVTSGDEVETMPEDVDEVDDNDFKWPSLLSKGLRNYLAKELLFRRFGNWQFNAGPLVRKASRPPGTPHDSSYLDYGHGLDSKDDKLWWANDSGSIETAHYSSSHTSTNTLRFWHGRYSAYSNTVTVAEPSRGSELDFNYIQSVLRMEFPGASIRLFH